MFFCLPTLIYLCIFRPSLKGMMLKLELQYFGHLMWRVDSLEKSLMLGEIGGRRRGQHRMRWLDGITDSMHKSLGEFGKFMMDREAQRTTIHGVTKSQTWLSDWTELNWMKNIPTDKLLRGGRSRFGPANSCIKKIGIKMCILDALTMILKATLKADEGKKCWEQVYPSTGS